MPLPESRIGSYAVALNGGPGGHNGVRARILLLDPGNRHNGTILFYQEGHPVPVVPGDQVPRLPANLHLPFPVFPTVMDLLRNEQPLYITTDRRGVVLSTSPEPQGEGEASQGEPPGA